MKQYGLNELREKYLSFFEEKGHLRHPSFPLVPQGDNSLLLINSGMAPLKPYFTGTVKPPGNRMTTCQKCIRTPDIERVGKTSRHGTFFEMLGNFSFGDYFKREATAWAWEFVTEVIGIPTEKLYVTVYLDDDEAYDIWTKEVGVDPSHVSRLGKEDNFWEIGMGPCGPCSEIYFDRGEHRGCGSPDCTPGCDCDRFVEFWNLVFTQYYNDGQGNYTELSSKNIDTGMGLERLACIVQDVESLFDVDTIMNITKHVTKITGNSYGSDEKTDVSLRVITDHIRSTTMMVCDGILPSNEGRGYVLRRLLRRAARHGRLLGIKEPFLYKVAQTVIEESGDAYPELREKRDYIEKVIHVEEENFSKTIDSGMRILEDMIANIEERGVDILSGLDAFKLYDTYGFPVDLTVEMLQEKGKNIDRAQFDLEMDKQKERARAATAALGDFGWARVDLGLDRDTEFTGYEKFCDTGEILAIVVGDELRSIALSGEEAVIVLDRTPFYAESGGQVADTGKLFTDNMVFEVTDVHKSEDGKYMHSGKVIEGEAQVSLRVVSQIDENRRKAIMRAHSATHLLHKALRNVLGTHVEQAGSLVTPDTVRFDFTHYSAMTPKEIAAVDREVNDMILEDLPVTIREMPIDEAKDLGATALFGEKYSDVVRVVKMGDYSTELCGGTHLTNTAKAGPFRLVSEFSVASGVRRIEATVGKRTLDSMNNSLQLINHVAAELKTKPLELEQKAKSMIGEMRELRKRLETMITEKMQGDVDRFLFSASSVEGLKVLTASVPEASSEDLKKMGDLMRGRDETIVAVLAAVLDGKVTFLAVCGKEAVGRGVRAGDLIREVTRICGGSGGGRPETAMGGGKDPDKLDNALAIVDDFVKEKVQK